MLAEIIVSAGAVLAAKECNLTHERRSHLFPMVDGAAFGPDFAQLRYGNLLDRVTGVRIHSQRIIGDRELLGFFAGGGFQFCFFLGFHFARGVADVCFALDELGDADAAATAVDVDKHVLVYLAVVLGPGGRELHESVRADGADFDSLFLVSSIGAVCGGKNYSGRSYCYDQQTAGY